MRRRYNIPNFLDHEEDLDRIDSYRPSYCDTCDADRSDQCICSQQQYHNVCKQCGHDHSYRNNFTGVQTSIDVIFSEQFNENATQQPTRDISARIVERKVGE